MLQTWNMVFSRDPDGRARQILSCAMDVTEHQKALREIQIYQEQLLSLATEISLAQEHERRQIAVALHDQIGQSLAMARMKLRATLKPVHDSQLREDLGQVTTLIEETLKETRSLTFELSPPILAELGFESAVLWLAKHVDERFGLRVELRKAKAELSLSPEMAAVLYQAVRELLMNVVKHAQVDSAKVSIRLQDEEVHVSVRDRGVGFDPSVIENPVRMDGFGLFSIRERLRYFGGRVSVESTPGKGTVVTLVAPSGPMTPGCLGGSQARKGVA
jgi:signal transduction histidine kinase